MRDFPWSWHAAGMRIRVVNRLLSLQDAEVRTEAVASLGVERVALAAAIGRVLAEPMRADRPLPPFSRAMMDGVALNTAHASLSAPLKVAGLHAAGDPPPQPLAAGEAWEIMTGAMVPDDCDAVVAYEDLGEALTLSGIPKPGQFIHGRGEDATAGQVLVNSGVRIGPAELAIAASVGLSDVLVGVLPRVAVLTTGDEAVPVDAQPEDWQIRQSNGPMLGAVLQRMGFSSVIRHHLADDPDETMRVMAEVMNTCDIILLCGGISRGRKDHVRSVVESLIGPPDFHGVRLRPGKPLAFWSGTPVIFALPGNPVSVLATFTRLVVPTLMRLQGLSRCDPMRVAVSEVSALPDFSWLLMVAPDAKGRLVTRPPRNSGDFASLAGAIGMIEVPPQSARTSDTAYPFFPFP